MFHDDDGKRIKNHKGKMIREDNNNNVGLHNDINFHDDGMQDINDTADGKHSIVTNNSFSKGVNG